MPEKCPLQFYPLTFLSSGRRKRGGWCEGKKGSKLCFNLPLWSFSGTLTAANQSERRQTALPAMAPSLRCWSGCWSLPPRLLLSPPSCFLKRNTLYPCLKKNRGERWQQNKNSLKINFSFLEQLKWLIIIAEIIWHQKAKGRFSFSFFFSSAADYSLPGKRLSQSK